MAEQTRLVTLTRPVPLIPPFGYPALTAPNLERQWLKTWLDTSPEARRNVLNWRLTSCLSELQPRLTINDCKSAVVYAFTQIGNLHKQINERQEQLTKLGVETRFTLFGEDGVNMGKDAVKRVGKDEDVEQWYRNLCQLAKYLDFLREVYQQMRSNGL